MSNNDGVVQGRLFPEYEVAVKAYEHCNLHGLWSN